MHWTLEKPESHLLNSFNPTPQYTPAVGIKPSFPLKYQIIRKIKNSISEITLERSAKVTWNAICKEMKLVK